MSIDIKVNNTNSILIVIRMRFFIKDIGNCLCSEIHSKLIQGILGETNSLKLDRYDIKIDSFQLKQPEILYNSLYINDEKQLSETV